MYLHIHDKDVPSSILVLEDSKTHTIEKNSHFVFRKIKYNEYCVDFFNGKDNRYSYARYSEDDLYRMFFDGKLKYKEFSLAQFNKIKAFL